MSRSDRVLSVISCSCLSVLNAPGTEQGQCIEAAPADTLSDTGVEWTKAGYQCHVSGERRSCRVFTIAFAPHLGDMHEDLNRIGLIDEDEIVLDEAALSLALLDHPGADLASYNDLLDAIESRLDLVDGDAERPAERAECLAAVLAGKFGFAGDAETYDDPANADLISVMDRRRGLPVSLSILWVAMARRLGWSADVLDVPGHVLVMIGAEAVPVIVDPFAGGVRVGAERLAALVEASAGTGRAVTHIAAMPNRAVLVRLLQNQASRAEQAGMGRRALELYVRMTTVAPAYPHAWWKRARLELVDHEIAAARGSLGAMLEVTRDPELRRRVTKTLGALPAD